LSAGVKTVEKLSQAKKLHVPMERAREQTYLLAFILRDASVKTAQKLSQVPDELVSKHVFQYLFACEKMCPGHFAILLNFCREDSDRQCLLHEHFKSYQSILKIATLQFC